MSAYVDYAYYTTNYLGGVTPTINATSFLFLEKKAENLLNQRTRGQYLNISDQDSKAKIKDCLCNLVESLNNESLAQDGGAIKQSESVGGHSVSYSIKTPMQYYQERNEIFKLYLWDLGILAGRKVYDIKVIALSES